MDDNTQLWATFTSLFIAVVMAAVVLSSCEIKKERAINESLQSMTAEQICAAERYANKGICPIVLMQKDQKK